MSGFIDCVRKKDLDWYLEYCRGVVLPNLNVEEARKLALAAIKYYQGNKSARRELSKGQALEERWYESLATGEPDYGVYDDDFFVSDLWACWVVYSRGYVKALAKFRGSQLLFGTVIGDQVIDEITTIADLGCGAGYTTAALQDLWPNAFVVGTNLPQTAQYRIASAIGVEHGFRMAPSVEEIKKLLVIQGVPTPSIDLVFASEYFEHFEWPIEHLRSVLDNLNPRYLVVANSFGSRSIGHFDSYLKGDERISNKKIGRHFNKYLRERGYEPVKTGLWNNRPAIWELTD